MSGKSTEFQNISAARSGLPYIYGFENTNPSSYGQKNGNNCGQAAIATIVEYWKKNVHSHIKRNRYNNRDQRYYPDNDAFVEAIEYDYPPDLLFGHFGTSKERIQDALIDYGMDNVNVYYDRGGNPAGQRELDILINWLENRYPVIVLLDLGPLDGKHWAFHYVVVYHYDGSDFYITNPYDKVPFDDFIQSWWCKGLPQGNNFMLITAAP